MQAAPRRVGGLVAMVVGTSLVCGGMVGMNARDTRPQERDLASMVAFHVEPPPARPPPSRPRPRPRKPAPESSAPPPPVLSGSLGGLSFGLPSLEGITGGLDALTGDPGDVVMTEDAVDTVPEPVERVPPEYPARARARDVEGYVTVSVLVTVGGTVADARVLDADPVGVFEEPALAAVRQWRFDPATYEGRAVAVRVRLTVRFALQ